MLLLIFIAVNTGHPLRIRHFYENKYGTYYVEFAY